MIPKQIAMRKQILLLVSCLIAVAILFAPHRLAIAKSAHQDSTSSSDPGKITAVTVHRGWAAVNRRIEAVMDAEVSTLRIPILANTILPDSIQAAVVGESTPLIAIRESQVIIGESESSTRQLRLVLAIKNPEENSQLINSTISIDFSYIASHADWVPAYSIRAQSDSASISVECDVLVGQNTGENWDDARLTVSSASGRVPEWKSVFRKEEIGVAENQSSPKQKSAGTNTDQISRDAAHALVDSWSGDGSVFNSDDRGFDWSDSPTVQWTLPIRVSVATNTLESKNENKDDAELGFGANASETQNTPNNHRIRFRLHDFLLRTPLRFIAVPAVSQNAFVVGTIRNIQDHHLLPAPVSLFLNSKYAGEMILPNLPPGEAIDVSFGTEPDLLVHRREINRKKRKTGILGDGRETTIEYQLAILNRTQKPAAVELWDQIPISTNNQITITIDNLSRKLSADAAWLQNQRPRGLLRWDLTVPPMPPAASPFLTIYTLVISHHKDVSPDWIPQ